MLKYIVSIVLILFAGTALLGWYNHYSHEKVRIVIQHEDTCSIKKAEETITQRAQEVCQHYDGWSGKATYGPPNRDGLVLSFDCNR